LFLIHDFCERDGFYSKKLYQVIIYQILGWAVVGSLFDEVLQAINDWNPKAAYSTENKYRDDLLAFLRKSLDPSGSSVYYSPIWGFDSSRHHLIKKEAGRSLVDIGIDDEIGRA
jgi:hypothetical protein